MEGLFSSVLPSLASALAGGTDDERVEALGQLAQVVDTSFGDDAVQVGGYLREHGVLKSLVWLLEHSDAVAIQQTTLLILGNLASDAVDASSTLTKVRLKELGAFEALLPHLFSDVWLTLVYALGAVQNMCTDVEYVEVMQDTGVVARLQELAATEDPQLEKYAKGCLSNMRETILAAAAARQWSVQASKVPRGAAVRAHARRANLARARRGPSALQLPPPPARAIGDQSRPRAADARSARAAEAAAQAREARRRAERAEDCAAAGVADDARHRHQRAARRQGGEPARAVFGEGAAAAAQGRRQRVGREQRGAERKATAE